MDGKKKAIDSFVGVDGGKRLTFEVVDKTTSKQKVKKERTFKRLPEEDNPKVDSRNLLDLSGVVRLPARNGNELEIERPVSEKKSFYGSGDFTKVTSKDFADNESADNMDKIGREGALDFLSEDEDSSEDSQYQENEKQSDDDFFDRAAGDLDRRRAYEEEGEFGMGIEDGSGKKVLWQVITVVGTIVTVVLASYVLFRIFYNAPEPASVGDSEVSQVVDSDDFDKTDEQGHDEEPVVVEEAVASIAVYNAGTVEGAAARLAEKLGTLDMQAEAVGNLSYNGSGYVVLDLVGTKPQASEKLTGELGVAVTKISAEELPSGAVADRDFVVIICD